MPLRVSNLRLSIGAPESALSAALARAIGVPAGELQAWRILRKSLDLRDHDELRFVYTVEVNVAEEDEPAILKTTAHATPRIEAFHEPRVKKRRSKQFDLMNQPRNVHRKRLLD